MHDKNVFLKSWKYDALVLNWVCEATTIWYVEKIRFCGYLDWMSPWKLGYFSQTKEINFLILFCIDEFCLQWPLHIKMNFMLNVITWTRHFSLSGWKQWFFVGGQKDKYDIIITNRPEISEFCLNVWSNWISWWKTSLSKLF